MASPFRAPGERTWGSVLVDVGVVVIGVLIAFALNSWWASRNAEQRRRAHLRALEADLERNLAALDAQVITRRRIAEESRSLFQLLRREGRAPRDSIVELLREVYRSSRYEPVLGAYENVVASGGLSQLGAPRLQASLANLVADLRNDYFRRFETDLYLELTRSYPTVLGYLPEPREAPPAVRSPGAPTLDALVSRPDYQSLLYARMIAARDVKRRLLGLQERLRDVLAEVRRELSPGRDRAGGVADSAGASSRADGGR